MRNLVTAVLFFFFALINQNLAYAGGCHLKEVTPAKMLASRHIANLLRDKLIEVESEMNKRGQNLQAVFVARSGESLKNFKIIPENDSKNLQTYLFELAEMAIANKSGNLTGKNGKPLPPSKLARLPKSIYLDETMRYSHLGLLIKKNNIIDPTKETVNDWIYVIDLLAECDENSKRYGQSDIFYHTFEQFYWDTKILESKETKHRSVFIVPTPEIQERLFQLAHNKEIGTGTLHQPKYNVAATPYKLSGLKEKNKNPKPIHQLADQNSNQWPIELLAAATKPVGEIRNRVEAQDLLWSTNYHPTLVFPTGFKEANACAFRKGPFWDASNLINCKDQVFKPQGIYQLITVRSAIDYMTKNQLLAENVYNPTEPAVYEVVVRSEDLEKFEEMGKFLESIDELFNPKTDDKKETR